MHNMFCILGFFPLTIGKIFYLIYVFVISVWQKLEEENADFFRAYYIRLKLKRQILLFNHLLEHQYNLMKYPMPPKVPLVPIQNGIHPMPGKFSPYIYGSLKAEINDFTNIKFKIGKEIMKNRFVLLDS